MIFLLIFPFYKNTSRGTGRNRTGFSAIFRSLIAGVLLLTGACLNPAGGTGKAAEFTFGVIDVGQGLAQIAQCGDSAVLFDIGPKESYGKRQGDL